MDSSATTLAPKNEDFDVESQAVASSPPEVAGMEEQSSVLDLVRKLMVEFTGTFFLCFTICFAAGLGAVLAPLAIGGMLSAMIYAGGHISGGAYNPAVVLAVLLRGKLTVVEAACYVLAEVIASFAAGGMAILTLPGGTINGHPAIAATADIIQALLIEAIFTFALCMVVLNAATTKAQEGNSFFGYAIGTIVTVGAISVGSISGGAFNPAVGTGLPIVAGVYQDVWVYWVGPCSGAIAAAAYFRLTAPSEFAAAGTPRTHVIPAAAV